MSLIEEARASAIIKGDAKGGFTTNVGTAAMIVKSIASYTTAPTLAVAAATSDLTFSIDGAVDPLIDSGDWSGGTSDAGVIDVSDTGFTTLGGVADGINRSAYHQCLLTGALRADLSANTLAELATGSSTDIYTDDGLKVNFDPAVALDGTNYASVSLAITANKFLPGNKVRKDEDNGGWVNELWYIECNLTYASGTTYIDIYEANARDNTEKLVARLAAGTTGAVQTYGNMLGPIISSSPGSRLIVRPISTGTPATFSAGYLTITGKSWNVNDVAHV